MLELDPERLLPHTGRMRLIDRVMSYDEERIVCESESHRATDHPLAENGRLSIVCGLEYGAQAMAVHRALLAGPPPATGAPHGYLISASELRWGVDRLDLCAAPLVIEAVIEFRAGPQMAYRFELRAGDRSLLSGRASVSQ